MIKLKKLKILKPRFEDDDRAEEIEDSQIKQKCN
jgi:hypothetical protein